MTESGEGEGPEDATTVESTAWCVHNDLLGRHAIFKKDLNRSLSGPAVGLLVAVALLCGPQTLAQKCEDLAALPWPELRITEVAPVPASAEPSDGITAAHCRVDGVIGKEIRFRLLLPDAWNGRFFMGGGGGFVGQVQNHVETTVNQGYATSGTDTGHQGGSLSASWALNDLERQLNFGHLAVHRTAVVSKALIRHYYGEEPAYSYFGGCSRGGGQALMEAQRYPGDFDGIVAGAPAFDWTGLTAEFLQNTRLQFPDPTDLSRRVITPDNLALLESAVLEACDGLDGVVDGVIDDPRECRFALETLPGCPNEEPGPDCLSRAQIEAIDRIYAPAQAAGAVLYPGQPFGSESRQAGWPVWITGMGVMPSGQWVFGTQFAKYFVFGDPDWDYTSYDFSTWASDMRFVATFMNATDPDLSRFKARGGKLILWHGWSDPALSAQRSISYFEEVERLDQTVRDFFRLFLLPGVEHCEGGPGPDRVDWVKAITEWVELGITPERIVATKEEESGTPVRTRLLCPHPGRATYVGSGSTGEAENYDCRELK